MPTTRQPIALAIWPAEEPTAPEAAETRSESVGLRDAIFINPAYAVKPETPITPSQTEAGAMVVSTFWALEPSDKTYVCHPPSVSTTRSPGAYASCALSTTSPKDWE